MIPETIGDIWRVSWITIQIQDFHRGGAELICIKFSGQGGHDILEWLGVRPWATLAELFHAPQTRRDRGLPPRSASYLIATPWWRGKRSRHSYCMRNTQFYIIGMRPVWKHSGSLHPMTIQPETRSCGTSLELPLLHTMIRVSLNEAWNYRWVAQLISGPSRIRPDPGSVIEWVLND